MISHRKQRQYLVTNLVFNSSKKIGRYQVVDLKTNDVISCELAKIKNEKEYKQKIKELRDYANAMNYPCYEPITVRIDKDGEIFSGSVSMRDESDNLDEIEDLAKEKGLI